jgi:peptidoglycan/LPS O-acetylase OafA/YrhL
MMFGVLPSARILQWQMLPHNLALILWGNLFHLSYTRRNLTDQAPAGANAGRQRTLTLLIAVLVLSPSCYSLFQYAMHGKPDNLRWGVAYPAAFALFLVAFFRVRRVPRAFVWLGEISYSTYLLHPFVVTLLIAMMQGNMVVYEFVDVPLFVIVSLVVTNALAGLSFLVLERPAIRLGKKLERLYRLRLAGSPG